MTTFQILTLLGIGGLATSLWLYILRAGKKLMADMKAIKLGLQAALRAQMIDDYNYYTQKGYAPIYAKDNFENCWLQYEQLGANGVMKDIHINFMSLPTKPHQKESSQ